MIDLNNQDTIEILYDVCGEFPEMAAKASEATDIYCRNFHYIYEIVNRKIRRLLFAMGVESQPVDREFILKELTRPIPLI